MKSAVRSLALAIKAAAPWGFLALTLGVLLFQAHLPQWRGHLEIDVRIYLLRVWPFLTEGNWRHLEFSEYPPATLWLFALLSSFTANPSDYDATLAAFLAAVISLNALLIVLHFVFFRRYGPRGASIIFLAAALAMGPILFFRFELLTTMLLLVAWELFRRDRFGASALLLGLAACTKIYPVVLLPLLLIELVRKRQMRKIPGTVLFFLAGIFVPAVAFSAWGGSLAAIGGGLRMQQLRTVALEGFWGTLITLFQGAMGIPRRVVDLNNERGLISDLWFLPNSVVGVAGIALTALLFVWMFRLPKERRLSDPVLVFLTLFVFTFFAKHENPQYRWWFAAFLPFLAPPIYPKSRWIVVASVLTALLLTQYIYPLHYGEFLDWFYGKLDSPRFFAISAARNGLLLLAVALTFAGQSFAWHSKQRTTPH
jgi:hypothetical protein